MWRPDFQGSKFISDTVEDRKHYSLSLPKISYSISYNILCSFGLCLSSQIETYKNLDLARVARVLWPEFS